MSSTSSASVEVITRGLPRSNALGIAGQGTDRENRLSYSMNCCPCSVSTRNLLRAFKITAALDDLHAAHLRQRRHAAAKLFQDGFLPRAQFATSTFGSVNVMPRCADSRALTIWCVA
jgi:hypothetical protein